MVQAASEALDHETVVVAKVPSMRIRAARDGRPPANLQLNPAG
jgi:hypothetical protein